MNVAGRIKSLFGLLLLTGTVCAQHASKNIFVSPQGNDNNKGFSNTIPVKTIAAGIRLAAPGDTIYLLAGKYREKINFDHKKGIPEKPIYLYGHPSAGDQKVLIDGGAKVPAMELNNNWIEFKNAAWIEIGNLSFRDGWTDPIRIDNSSYLSFKHCDFYGGRKVILGTGIETHHILVENCKWNQGGERLWTIEKDSLGVDAWLSMHHELMGYYNGSLVDSRASGGSFVIRNNFITNAYNGIRFTSKKGYDANVEIYNNVLVNIRDNDFEPEHYAYNMHIYHNRSRNIHKSLSVDDVAGGYIYYYGNTVTMDSSAWAKEICSGFWKIYGGVDSLIYPLYAFNNSFFTYGKAFNSMEKNARQFKHFNNAYYFAGPEAWVLKIVDPSNEFDNDISNQPWSNTMKENRFERNGKIANPGFIDPLHGNFQLQKNSPAIDAGRIMKFKEFDWTQTYTGKAPDIGAYENGQLVDGPAFRFRVPENAKFVYKEMPRIVKYKTNGTALILYFSEAINPASLSANTILLKNNGKNVSVQTISFPNNKYELVIQANGNINQKNITIQFTKMPTGLNGQTATGWASAIAFEK
jgi:hypothetical protein